MILVDRTAFSVTDGGIKSGDKVAAMGKDGKLYIGTVKGYLMTRWRVFGRSTKLTIRLDITKVVDL
jgi:hypothetical protein